MHKDTEAVCVPVAVCDCQNLSTLLNKAFGIAEGYLRKGDGITSLN